jgi:regulator of sigma D
VPVDPIAKVQQTPAFLNIVSELDINKDQLIKRQKIIRDIETELSTRHNASNKMISYVVRFGHPRALMTSADIARLKQF